MKAGKGTERNAGALWPPHAQILYGPLEGPQGAREQLRALTLHRLTPDTPTSLATPPPMRAQVSDPASR
jgi:hypothetical protein